MGPALFLMLSGMITLGSTTTTEGPPHQRLIKFHPNKPAKWMSNEELEKVARDHHPFGFMDLTRKGSDIEVPESLAAPTYFYPTLPTQQKALEELFSHLKTERIESIIRKLSSYHSRESVKFYGDTQAEGWLNKEISSIMAEYKGGAFTFRRVPYIREPLAPDWVIYAQNNTIVKLAGQDPELKDELIILGSHYDSINQYDNEGRAPGADDNASGCAVLLEVLRLIVKFEIKLKHGLELHWYAAEEKGLLGSQDVVVEYKDKAKVKGMLNLDCAGYQSSKTMAWFEAGTNKALTEFVKMLVREYTEYDLRQGECPGWCSSDHEAWTSEGFPAAFLTEGEFTPHLHKETDTAETVNFEQVKEFAKVALAFVIELSETTQVPELPKQSTAVDLGGGWITGWIGVMICIWNVSFLVLIFKMNAVNRAY